jgi:hypothetical protein
MAMLLVCPATSHRKVEDCPRWIEVGSAENCVIRGAAGAGGVGVTAVGAGGGGGGGGGGTFFLPPAANSVSITAIQMSVNFRVLNMNIVS